MLKNIILKQHQKDGVDFLLDGKKLICADPGMGKTYTALEAASRLMSEDSTLGTIIIVPTTALEPFNKSFPAVPFPCFNAYKKHNKIPKDSRVVMFTYEELKYAVSLSNLGRWISIFDEAHMLLDSGTTRYKEAMKLRDNCMLTWGLTGTPLINSVPNLYNFINFFYPGSLGKSYIEFENRYLVMDKAKSVLVLRKDKTQPGVTYNSRLHLNFCDDIKDAKHLRDLLNSMMYRAVRDYDIDFLEVYSEMSYSERSQYKKATDGYIDSEGYKITPASRYYNQQEVCSGSDPNLKGVSGKLKNIIRLTRGIVNRGEGVLIYCTSKRTINMITEAVNGIGKHTYVLTGEMKMRDRINIQNILQSGDVVVMDDAGVASMNLQAVNNIIIAENSWSSGIFTQLIGRICRVDSKYDRQHVYICITKNSVDEEKWGNISRKLAVQQALFGTSTASGRGKIRYSHLGQGWDLPVEGSYWDILKEQGLASDKYLGRLQGLNKSVKIKM